MLSFHGNEQIKTALVARMDAHSAADEIIKGTGWENGKGCFIGCSLNNYDYSQWPVELGLPEWLARLCDSIFEGLPNGDAMTFATELPRRIPVGVDLEPVQHFIAIARIDRMLATQRKALEASHAHGVQEAIVQTVSALEIGRRAHEAAAGGNNCELSTAAWSAAAGSAGSAAESAWSAAESAWSAAESAAGSAAWSAWSAAESAWSAAESAAGSAAESAAWSAESAAWSAGSAAWSAGSAAYQKERDALYAALDSLS